MDNPRPQRKILRSPSVKRKSKVLPVNQRVKLERVLGVTVGSNAGLSCDSNNGTIAYPAGCVAVLFNPRRNKQSHIFNVSKKTITAVAFSKDGKHLITGETGHQPAVRVWDVAEKTQVAEFRGHKFGINCVAFSPNMKEIVSVGTQHDMMINVWNWKTGNKVASNKVSSKVSALACSEDGKCFVTVGNRHVRFWYLEERRSKINQTVPLSGRSGILGDQKDNFFCDVVAGQGPQCGRFFVITQSGLLCEFNEKRQLDKWVELRTKSANCITAGQDLIFVGCAEGVVRVFSATSLHYLCSLPKPHHLGVEVTTATSPSHMVSNREDAKYPDAMAIAVDDDHKKVTCIYNDRSVYIWDVHDIKRVGKAWSFLYHSGCVWALEVYPQLDDGVKATLPPGSFLTASGDNTIRVWNLNTHMPENTAYKRNIYSNELLKIVYSDPNLTSLCNVDYNPAGATDKTDTTYDGKNGVRSIRVSPDGADLASGDRQGNIRIYDMEYMSEKKCVEAHESDVMCLEYSYSNTAHLLATSGRDRLIHVFDVDQKYGLVQTLGDHSSSITAVRFTDTENKLRMISCGADKSILLRNAVTSPDFQFQLEHHLATKITLYDMVIDPAQKCLATACQDRNVRLYNIQTTKEKKCYRGSSGDEGVLLRIHLDPSGTYAATTCTDKNVCILDFNTGELMATMYGHSEVITGVKFANDLKHVITVSADGCIFVWRLPSEMTTQIKQKLQDMGKQMKDTDYIRSDQPLMPNPVMLDGTGIDGSFPVVKSASIGHIPMLDDDSVDGRGEDDDEDDDNETLDDTASHASLDYRFSIGQLPKWAKAKFGDANSEGDGTGQEQVQPKGRWAQRVDHTIEFKSQLDLTSEEDTQSDRRRNLGPEGSASHLAELRRETVVLGKSFGNKNLPIIGDDIRGSTGDLRSSLPATPKALRDLENARKTDLFTPFKSDTALSSSGSGAKRWLDRFDLVKANSLELDDTDDLDTGSDTTEVIYPPTDSDSDLYANSYRVFAVDDVKKQKSKTSQGNVSNQDDASESTDPVSLEDDDDPNDETLAISNPTTPSDPDKEFLARTTDKEDFVRENFEEDSFTPVPLEKFTKSVETLERQINDGAAGSVFESTPFSPRLSLSARFMSRSQPHHKNFSSMQNYRQDNWFSRNKMEMARAMDETRKSLLAMNLRSDSNESDSPEKEDPPSPPTKLEEEADQFRSTPQPTNSSYVTSPPTVFVSPPWGYCSKNLRYLWATFTLSQESITEETTFAHASRAPVRYPPTANPRANKTPLQPRPPTQLYQSRIPMPRSSPRPCRARRVTQAACAKGNSTNTVLSPLTNSPPSNTSRTTVVTCSSCSKTITTTVSGNKASVTNETKNNGRGLGVKAPQRRCRTQSPRSPSTHRDRGSGADLENRLKNSPKDPFPKGRPGQGRGTSPSRTTPPSASSPVARRISQERERRRSSRGSSEDQESKATKTGDNNSSEVSSTKPALRTRPTYFKTTQSSRNKLSKNSDVPPENTVQPDKSQDIAKKKLRGRGRLLGSKVAMYASTPNLISGLEDEEDEEKEPPKITMKSTSNLRLLSDLSRSVPDVNDADSSTDSSSCGSGPKKPSRRSDEGQRRLMPKFTMDLSEQKLMPPPAAPSSRTGAAYASYLHAKKGSQDVQPQRKSSTSELTLDQAKSILLGKSGVLGSGSKQAQAADLVAKSASRPSRESRESASSGQSSISTLTGNSPPVFDPDLANVSAAQLAVAEGIEHTANMLRHQKQANLSNAFSPERRHSQPPSNLEASPLDLPERDQPSPSQRRPSSKPPSSFPSSTQNPNLSKASSQPFQNNMPVRTAPVNSTFLAGGEGNSGDTDAVFEETVLDDDNPRSVRDRIARLQSQTPGKEASSGPLRRILPASPNTSVSKTENRDSPRSHSDTGLGSESSDTDTASMNTATYNVGTKNKPVVTASSGNLTALQKADRSKLALNIAASSSSPATTSAQVSVTHCQSVLEDFRSQLGKLKDLFTQVDGRTDENAQQILQLLGEVFHEAQSVITDLASKTPSPPSKDTDMHNPSLESISSASSLALHGSQAITFHSSTASKTSISSKESTINGSCSSLSSQSEGIKTLADKLAVLSATKDMLQPLVSQLSQDLSEGIIRTIKEKMDKSS